MGYIDSLIKEEENIRYEHGKLTEEFRKELTRRIKLKDFHLT